MGRDTIVESLRWGANTSLCCTWNPTSSSANTFSLDKLIPIFSGRMLGTRCQSNTYFLLPFTQCLMSAGQKQHLYSTLSVGWNFFFEPWYVVAGVPCLPFPTLALHKRPILTCVAQHISNTWCWLVEKMDKCPPITYGCPIVCKENANTPIILRVWAYLPLSEHHMTTTTNAWHDILHEYHPLSSHPYNPCIFSCDWYVLSHLIGGKKQVCARPTMGKLMSLPP